MSKKEKDEEEEEGSSEEIPILDNPAYKPPKKSPEELLEEACKKMPWHTNLCSIQLKRDSPAVDAKNTRILGHIRDYTEAITVAVIQSNHGGGTYSARFRGPGKNGKQSVIYTFVGNIVIGGEPFVNNITPPQMEGPGGGGTEETLLRQLQSAREQETKRADEERLELKQMVLDASSRTQGSSTEVISVIREIVSQREKDGAAQMQRIADMTDRAGDALRQANESHGREVRELGERHRDQIEQIRQDFRAQLDAVRDESVRYRQEARENTDGRERDLRDVSERRERDLRDDFSKREVYLRDQATREEKVLRERLDEVKEELRNYRVLYEGLRTDLQNSQFGLAKAEFAATLAEKGKGEGGLEGMVKQIESAKTVMGWRRRKQWRYRLSDPPDPEHRGRQARGRGARWRPRGYPRGCGRRHGSSASDGSAATAASSRAASGSAAATQPSQARCAEACEGRACRGRGASARASGSFGASP